MRDGGGADAAAVVLPVDPVSDVGVQEGAADNAAEGDRSDDAVALKEFPGDFPAGRVQSEFGFDELALAGAVKNSSARAGSL